VGITCYICSQKRECGKFMNKRTVAVVGGGAAGFFAAINLKEMRPDLEVSIFERSPRVLAKVEISGGGRCNCTNTFEGVGDLSKVYPRGHRLMKRLMNVFDHHSAYEWFERHGVPLVTQPDHCVFPAAQDSHAIIDCFLQAARRLGITIHTRRRIVNIDDLEGFDYVVVTTGGSPHSTGLQWLCDLGHKIEPPVPSLFSFSIADERLKALMGIVAEDGVIQLPGTKFRSEGAILVTHWGLSGPAILKLSSHAARHLHDHDYHGVASINWTGKPESETREALSLMVTNHRQKQLSTLAPLGVSHRLWQYLMSKAKVESPTLRWGEMGKKTFNCLVNVMTKDEVALTGRAPFRDEFVTCGGISLSSVNASTLESKVHPGLYFAGEVLDVDGVTGGFNFQAAWTTAYVVAKSIAGRQEEDKRGDKRIKEDKRG